MLKMFLVAALVVSPVAFAAADDNNTQENKSTSTQPSASTPITKKQVETNQSTKNDAKPNAQSDNKGGNADANAGNKEGGANTDANANTEESYFRKAVNTVTKTGSAILDIPSDVYTWVTESKANAVIATAITYLAVKEAYAYMSAPAKTKAK